MYGFFVIEISLNLLYSYLEKKLLQTGLKK